MSKDTVRILVCEDDFGSRKIMTRMLNAIGQVDAAINGREAVDAVNAAREACEPYDIITLDLMMPEMDGQEALELIRKGESIDQATPARILMTTATGDYSAVAAAFREHCDGYLLKPIRQAELLEKLAALGFARR